MVQVELDEIAEVKLAQQAHRRGMSSSQLAAELVRTGLQPVEVELTPQIIEKRQQAIDRILELSNNHTLGLREMGMTMREFIHSGHKY